MTWLTWLLGFVPHRHQPIDQLQVREELTRDDPDFARVRRAQHDALQAITARRLADGLAIRDERQFWSEHGGEHPPRGTRNDG